MPHRKLSLTALVLLAFAASPWGDHEASAQWGPVVGAGFYFDVTSGDATYFSTSNGSFGLNYDPGDLAASSISFSTGSPGFGADAFDDFTVSDGGTTFSAMYGLGGMIIVTFDGNPGPLNPDGDPLSLDYLANSGGYIDVRPSYNVEELRFAGHFASVPEPSSLLTLTLGLGGVSLAYLARKKKGPGPPGLAGR